ncbi:hypothetical protein SUGI_0971630 [Cryptomeria japonica]|nr:hypothetical protein SUGI_0971630 [Cryptomeria japonica]
MAGNVVTTMLSKGYTLSKDALVKAKELDDKYQVTATSAAKATSMGKDAWTKAIELEEKYQVRANATAKVTSLGKDTMTKTKELEPVVTAKMVSLGKSAGSKVNPYICAGALWVSENLEKGSKAASDWATKGN